MSRKYCRITVNGVKERSTGKINQCKCPLFEPLSHLWDDVGKDSFDPFTQIYPYTSIGCRAVEDTSYINFIFIKRMSNPGWRQVERIVIFEHFPDPHHDDIWMKTMLYPKELFYHKDDPVFHQQLSQMHGLLPNEWPKDALPDVSIKGSYYPSYLRFYERLYGIPRPTYHYEPWKYGLDPISGRISVEAVPISFGKAQPSRGLRCIVREYYG